MEIYMPKHEDLLPKPVPAGVYKVRWTSPKAGVSQEDNQKLSFMWEIIAPAMVGDQKTAGRKVIDNFVFTEKALWKIAQIHKELTGQEIPEAKYSIDELIARLTSALTNKEALIRVEVVKSQDGSRDVNQVREVKNPNAPTSEAPAGGGAASSLTL